MHEVSILTTHPRDSEAAKQRKLFVLRRTIPDAKLKKTSTEERVEAILGCASRFTRHVARYT